MEIENQQDIEFSDTPSYIKGMIYALKSENYSVSLTSDKIIAWGYLVSKSTVQRLWAVLSVHKNFESKRENCGRKEKLSQKSKDLILDAIEENIFLNAQDIQRNNKLNQEKVSAFAIQYYLTNIGLKARKMLDVILFLIQIEINDFNFVKNYQRIQRDCKRFVFLMNHYCVQTNFKFNGFEDIYDQENLEEKYWNIIDKWQQGIRQTVQGIINKDGLLDLIFVYDKINQDVYQEIIDVAEETIEKIKKNQLIFMQVNALAHKAKTTLEQR